MGRHPMIVVRINLFLAKHTGDSGLLLGEFLGELVAENCFISFVVNTPYIAPIEMLLHPLVGDVVNHVERLASTAISCVLCLLVSSLEYFCLVLNDSNSSTGGSSPLTCSYVLTYLGVGVTVFLLSLLVTAITTNE
ncbi:hypothetical protein F2Q70_00001989 [Brassica cretica]|uniref:Uncharacterized protein n=2 Tax=Brassica cretica TaxID=69181 RepID=A0A8S9IVI3_BRACR|nr:hypothetical protein F2Q68_00020044 [Brassica cretica]KAF2573919.1 hypothetical protein F2Q70_00001989 [Brassica cretica]KAF3562392.1 hypothetical protein DY000_02013324 [Brassica cretica]